MLSLEGGAPEPGKLFSRAGSWLSEINQVGSFLINE